MEEYSADIVCAYKEKDDDIKIDFSYKDSNGVVVKSRRSGGDINDITKAVIGDIVSAMAKNKAEREKPKKPEDMTKEELLEALKLMEREANVQKTKNDLLERRLRASDDVKTAKRQRQRKYDNSVHVSDDIMDGYRKLLSIIVDQD